MLFLETFQQSHARLVERERRVSLPWLLEQDLGAPRPQVRVESSDGRGKPLAWD